MFQDVENSTRLVSQVIEEFLKVRPTGIKQAPKRVQIKQKYYDKLLLLLLLLLFCLPPWPQTLLWARIGLSLNPRPSIRLTHKCH